MNNVVEGVGIASSLLVGTSFLLWFLKKHNKSNTDASETQLLEYAAINDVEGIKKLANHKNKAKIANALDGDKNTPLIISLKNGSVAASMLLINEFGASVEAVNGEGWSCLLAACLGGSLELVELVYSRLQAPTINEPNHEGWTALHIAATKGAFKMVQFLVEKGANVNAKNKAGHTALLIASCNGYPEIVQFLASHAADPVLKTEKLESALLLAVRNGHLEIAEYILSLPNCSEPSYINAATITGATALHAASKRGLPEFVELLVKKGADINCQERDGGTPLHGAISCNHPQIVKFLLENNAKLDTTNRFGITPLHDAAFFGRVEIVKMLMERGADSNSRDNDGLTPLHIICTATNSNRGNTKDSDHPGALRELLKHGANINTLDGGGSNPLYICAFAGDRGAQLVPILLEYGADYTSENVQGWTPLHAALSKSGHPTTAQLIEEHAKVHNPEFLATFDRTKPRIMGRRLNTDSKVVSIFGEAGPNLEAIAERISTGQCKKVIVLLGAGISVAAGIPDFRSPDSGIYSQSIATKYNLESPAAAFDLMALHRNPVLFYRLVKDIFYPVITGHIKPTKTHKFLKLLKDHNILTRIYTQNIDMLEYRVGLTEDDVIEAHGSFKSAECIKCRKAAVMDDVWKSIENDQVPKCKHCGDTIRPGIIFFGEALPSRFFEFSMQDLRACDLLIVIGTSLKVYPFAALVNDVPPATPRLLFNREEVGPFKGCAVNKKGTEAKEKEEIEVKKGGRDAAWLGECDEGVAKLAELIGWDLQ